MDCPKCNSSHSIKSGKINGRQRYKCKECDFNYTVILKSTAKHNSLKKSALHLYLEGLGFRSIGRILGVSNVSVLNWIRSFGEKVQELQATNQPIGVVEVDEMHTYIGSKKLLLDMDCC